jgi:hypothetical protein
MPLLFYFPYRGVFYPLAEVDLASGNDPSFLIVLQDFLDEKNFSIFSDHCRGYDFRKFGHNYRLRLEI